MNICFFTIAPVNPQIGGVERVTYNLQKYFESKGLQIFFFHLYGQESPRHFILPDSKINSKEQIISFINNHITQNTIDIIIDQYGNELFSHKYIPNNVKIIRCEHLNIIENKIINCLLGSFSFREFKSSLLNLLFLINTPLRWLKRRYKYKFINKYIDKYVVLSESYIKQLIHKGIDPNKVFAISNAVNTTQGVKCPKENLIIYCGRLVHNPKNILFLPNLWAHLSKKFNNWQLIIIGDGPDRGILERKIKKFKLERIYITGYINPEELYNKAKILVQPSYNEGFGMVIAEAMLKRCVPVVFNATSAYADLITNDTNGYVVNHYNKNEFISKCAYLMSNEKERIIMADNGYDHIQERYNIDIIGNKWFELFNNVTNKNSKR